MLSFSLIAEALRAGSTIVFRAKIPTFKHQTSFAAFLCCLHKNFAPNTNAFSRQREADVLHWSSMRPPRWRNLAFATYSSTSVFGLVAHSEGSWQVLKGFWCDSAFSCSSNDCLSEEKTGSSLNSQDRVRALLIVCVKLECSKLGSSFISALIWGFLT